MDKGQNQLIENKIEELRRRIADKYGIKIQEYRMIQRSEYSELCQEDRARISVESKNISGLNLPPQHTISSLYYKKRKGLGLLRCG